MVGFKTCIALVNCKWIAQFCYKNYELFDAQKLEWNETRSLLWEQNVRFRGKLRLGCFGWTSKTKRGFCWAWNITQVAWTLIRIYRNYSAEICVANIPRALTLDWETSYRVSKLTFKTMLKEKKEKYLVLKKKNLPKAVKNVGYIIGWF